MVNLQDEGEGDKGCWHLHKEENGEEVLVVPVIPAKVVTSFNLEYNLFCDCKAIFDH